MSVLSNRTAIALAMLVVIVTSHAARADEFDTSKIRGTVTDAAGGAVAGADVWVKRTEGGPPELAHFAEWKTTTDKDGKYELTLRYAKGKTLFVREVFAETRGYVRAAPDLKIPLQGGNNASLDFKLNKGDLIAGVMPLPLLPWERNMPAESLADVKTRYFVVDGPTVNEKLLNGRVYHTDADGKFEFYLPHGEYTLSVLGYDAEPLEWKGIKSGQRGLELKVPPFEWKPESVGKVFDELWDAMNLNYSYFFLKKDVDWKALHDTFRPAAVKSKNAAELAAVLKEMLAPLDDMHVWIETPTGTVYTSKRGGYAYNGNSVVTLAQLDARVQCGNFAMVGKTKPYGFGYLLMLRQSSANAADVKTAVEAIQKLRDVPGFVVDLRAANGGDESLAREIARQFCPKDTVYAKSKFRDGPEHQFGQIYDRLLLAARDAYTNPVICLIGPGAVSSGEGFVEMMICLPNVTTVGMPTRGASGNPKTKPLGRSGLTVYYSSWVDMLPNGKTIEGVGIPPDIRVDLTTAAYAATDPTLEKGLEVLRSKVAAAR
jgi:carboxyl-terminal processing protease